MFPRRGGGTCPQAGCQASSPLNVKAPQGNNLTTKALALIVLVTLTGCAVGPNYVKPTASVPTVYKEAGNWKKANPQDGLMRGEWWKIFNDPQLDALEAQVNISNQNIAQAQAQYAQAQAAVQAARSGFFPTLTATGSYTRAHGSNGSSLSGSSYAVSQDLLSGNVSWELDLWGRIRRTVEASRATAQASAADLENAKLSAQAQLAQDYFQISSLDVQKKLLDNTQVIYKRFLDLTKNRHANGVASETDVIQA